MKSSKLIFPLFLLITLIAFYPTIDSGFVFDFLGWQRVYDGGSIGDIIHSFGYKGNHQTLHFFFYSLYALFHINGIPWYLVFCGLHAFNGWLLYTWLRQTTCRWEIRAAVLPTILICILFLIHPYNVEPVVWKVCIHYLLSLSFLLVLFILTPKYLHSGQKKVLLWISLLYALSFFLLELSYITPLVISFYLLVEYFANKPKEKVLPNALILGCTLWGVLIVGLLINRWTLGAWVGHYGAETHLHLDILGMMSNELKYLLKHLFDARYFSFKTKALLFDNLSSTPEIVFSFIILCISVGILYVIKIKKLPGYIHLSFLGISVSMLFVLPVSNLFFYHLHIGMNDRLSYLPLVFLLVSIYAILLKCPRWMGTSALSLLILLHVFLQHKHIQRWKESTSVLNSLRETFRWHDKSHVFVLNSPDNLNGIVMASIIEAPSGIDELIDFQTSQPYNGIMYDVFQYNMTTPHDGVTIEQTGPLQLKVTFRQWGNWWHRNAIGASSYENEYYKAEVLEYPYQLIFKNLPENSAIIYQDGDEWKEFVFEDALMN